MESSRCTNTLNFECSLIMLMITACQTLHGAPFQWAAIFHKSAIRFTNGGCNIKFYNNDTRSDVHELPCKVLCAKCNSPLADEGRNMFMVRSSLWQCISTNGRFAKTWHLPGSI